MMQFKYAVAPFIAALVLLTGPAFATADDLDRARHWMSNRFRDARDASFRHSVRRHSPPAKVAVRRGSRRGRHSRPVLLVASRAKAVPAVLRTRRTTPQVMVIVQHIYVVHGGLRMH